MCLLFHLSVLDNVCLMTQWTGDRVSADTTKACGATQLQSVEAPGISSQQRWQRLHALLL
jgi:hypothetical protein